VRSLLLETIHSNLTSEDKEFLLAFVKGEPIWDKVDYSMYPSISWKSMNIDILKKNNPKKFQEQITLLEQVLY